MKDHFFSIIIPVYNAKNTIKECLESIGRLNYRHFEAIVINDCSGDSSVEIIKKFPCKLINLKEKKGPAHARNIGIKNSKGDILFFMDSDAEIDSSALDLVLESFRTKNVLGVISIPDKVSLRKGLVPNFIALKNHHSLHSIKNPYTNFFTTTASALKREVIEKYGYFDENYKEAHIEDIELGLRLPKNKVFINKEFIVKHHFSSFSGTLKKYLKRSILLSQLVKKGKGAPNSGHGGIKQYLLTLPVSFSLLFFALSFLYKPITLLFFLMVVFFLLLNFSLFSFIYKERGLLFVLNSIVYEYIFSIVINLGVVIGLIKK